MSTPADSGISSDKAPSTCKGSRLETLQQCDVVVRAGGNLEQPEGGRPEQTWGGGPGRGLHLKIGTLATAAGQHRPGSVEAPSPRTSFSPVSSSTSLVCHIPSTVGTMTVGAMTVEAMMVKAMTVVAVTVVAVTVSAMMVEARTVVANRSHFQERFAVGVRVCYLQQEVAGGPEAGGGARGYLEH
ncbi:MAG: hypothetical protein FRX49_00127 [Trebouxia sp. A1-2]|nr:MAG: hypothetical protein FRX49_00127 [Trebouxia sp. A1-2]